jgi:transposase InsO family protein
MDERLEFVRLLDLGDLGMAELCRRFGISRDTGYRLLSRWRAEGVLGLADRSRRPLASPRRTSVALEQAVLELRAAHPAWGGRKLARRLADQGWAQVPQPSTVTAILRRHGCLDASERQKPFQRFEHSTANDLWQMDFKGHFPAGPGRCHPLTVLDDHSRFALGLEACADEQSLTVKSRLTAIFRRYGLPRRLLCDNGAPWGVPNRTTPGTGWTALGVWLLRLGVRVSHGRPHHPQTQGKDERFHRSLKAEVLALQSFDSLDQCQKAFDRWRPVYNHERPHDALGLATPATRFTPSPRPMPEVPPMPEYDQGDTLRKIDKDGYFAFHGQGWKISQAFAGYQIALRPTRHDGRWTICFASHDIGSLDIAEEDRKDQTVRHVSEHPSDMSPV